MIKKDINLLPARKKLSSSVTVGIPIGAAILALLLFAGIYFPNAALKSKQSRLDELTRELESYGDVNIIYPQKLAELNRLQEVVKNYEDFFSGSKDVLTLVNLLDSITPEEINIIQYDFRNTEIVISGFADSDLDIADFEDILWKTNLFSDINLGTISGEDEARNFIFTMFHTQEGGENQ